MLWGLGTNNPPRLHLKFYLPITISVLPLFSFFLGLGQKEVELISELNYGFQGGSHVESGAQKKAKNSEI